LLTSQQATAWATLSTRVAADLLAEMALSQTPKQESRAVFCSGASQGRSRS
jgi:hypothetical protein